MQGVQVPVFSSSYAGSWRPARPRDDRVFSLQGGVRGRKEHGHVRDGCSHAGTRRRVATETLDRPAAGIGNENSDRLLEATFRPRGRGGSVVSRWFSAGRFWCGRPGAPKASLRMAGMSRRSMREEGWCHPWGAPGAGAMLSRCSPAAKSATDACHSCMSPVWFSLPDGRFLKPTIRSTLC